MKPFLRSGDFWSGLALAALGTYIVIQARGWVYMNDDGPGAGFWGPSMIAVPEVSQYDIVSIETTLVDAKTHRVVWAGTTETFNPTTVRQETPGFADLIIGQLQARGLLVAPKS